MPPLLLERDVAKPEKKKKEPRINLLAIGRRSQHVCGCLKPRRGNVFISSDLSGAEPTFLLNFSDDLTLKSVLYDMVGKVPEWKDGVLLSDSLYVTTMSKTELLEPILKSLPPEWYSSWVSDNDAAKKALGTAYKLAKTSVLAMLYGQTPFGIVRSFSAEGLIISEDDAKKLHHQFWSSLPQAYRFMLSMQTTFTRAHKQKRPVMGPFGFPIPSAKPADGMNRVIQSSVSSFMRLLGQRLFPNKFSELSCIIHDEMVCEVREDCVEDYREHLFRCLEETNKACELSFPLKLGFTVGKTFYDIH